MARARRDSRPPTKRSVNQSGRANKGSRQNHKPGSSKISKPIKRTPLSDAAKRYKLHKLRDLKKLAKTLSGSFYSTTSTSNGNNNNRQRKPKKSAKSTASKGKPKSKEVNRVQSGASSSSANTSRTRSRSKTKFTHTKKSASRIKLDACASGTSLPRLKYDSTEYSASTLVAMEAPKNLCHVEVCANPKSSARVRELKNRLKVFLKKRKARDVQLPYTTDPYLKENIHSINVIPPVTEEKKLSSTGTKYQIHVFQANDAKYFTGEWEEEETVTAKHWMLPNTEFEGIWENLIYDSPVKEEILNYAMTMLMYGDKEINRNIVCCNRVVLLHGPPGTGKTSLCRAMAQKLCIRLSHKYRQGQLVEINSQGLFSKYYSESGKLVGKMFDKIQEFINKKDSLVCILIDEVESLANNRRNMMHGNEPSDSMRVVNALLTRLDEVRRYPNVIVFTTSNVTRAIETAFLDRADIKKYIGLPNAEAIYSVYRGCVHEIMRAGVITPKLTLLEWGQLDGRKGLSSNDPAIRHSLKLKQLSMASVGLSGRSLRKLPMLFHAEYLPAQKMELNNSFWEAKHLCIKNQFKEMERLKRDPEL